MSAHEVAASYRATQSLRHSQSMTDSNLSEKAKDLLQEVANESDELDGEVTVEELVQHLCREYLVDDSEEELTDTVAERQKAIKKLSR